MSCPHDEFSVRQLDKDREAEPLEEGEPLCEGGTTGRGGRKSHPHRRSGREGKACCREGKMAIVLARHAPNAQARSAQRSVPSQNSSAPQHCRRSSCPFPSLVIDPGVIAPMAMKLAVRTRDALRCA